MRLAVISLILLTMANLASAARCADDSASGCWNRSLLLFLDLNESKGNRMDEIINHTFVSQNNVNSKQAIFGNGSWHEDSGGQQYLNASAHQDIKAFDNFTVCMLVNFTSIDGFQNVLWSRTCYTGNPSCPASQKAWRLAEHNTGQLLFSVWNGLSNNFACEISSTSISVQTNSWNLICGRKNATALSLFINGTQVGQSGCSANTNNQTDIAISIGQDSAYAGIGIEDNYKPDFIADMAFLWNGSLPVEMMQKLATNTEHGFTSLGDLFYVSAQGLALSNLFCLSCQGYDPSPGTAPYEANTTTPTFNLTTGIPASCAIADVNLNYTAMTEPAFGGTALRNCTGSTDHTCSLLASDALLINETDYLYISCQAGNQTGSSGALQMSLSSSNLDAIGDAAIQAGIDVSVISGAAVYESQQIYLLRADNTQILATWDKVAAEGSQRWLFNYLSSAESFINGLFNLTPAAYAAEYKGQTFQAVNTSVRTTIDATNQ